MFDRFSRINFGSEYYADAIKKANSKTTPIDIPGIDVLTDKLNAAISSNTSEVALLIEGKRFRFWSAMRITRSLDAVDTIQLSAPFDISMKDQFKPFSYKPIVVTVGGEVVFTGTLIGVNPTTDKTIEVTAYSKPAVLSDCTAPAGAYPLEFSDLNLFEIASNLAEPFGITVKLQGDAGMRFERVALEPEELVFDFLSDLAKQRGLILSSTTIGELLILQPTPSQPVAFLEQGAPPLLSVEPFFSPQEYYSHLTGLESVSVGSAGSQYTIKNPHLSNVIRPISFKSEDVKGGSLQQSVSSKISRMYANMVSYNATVTTWRTSSGKIWTPNDTIKLKSDDAMIYNNYTFMIRSVDFYKDALQEYAVLDLILPNAFSNEIPEVLPWH